MNTAERKQVYFNKPQRLTQLIAANTTVIVAGRRTGKTDSIAAPFVLRNMQRMPGSTGGIAVVFYYDTTALGSNYAVNEQDFHWNVVHEFELRGWRVESVYLGNPMHHHEKYLLINNAFAGKQRLMPFFNRSNNKDLILAIQSAGVSNGRNGFRKDKSGEKLAESEEDLLEHRTDGSDAFDTLFIGCEKLPYRDSLTLSISGVS